jgi:hypothetical protein
MEFSSLRSGRGSSLLNSCFTLDLPVATTPNVQAQVNGAVWVETRSTVFFFLEKTDKQTLDGLSCIPFDPVFHVEKAGPS